MTTTLSIRRVAITARAAAPLTGARPSAAFVLAGFIAATVLTAGPAVAQHAGHAAGHQHAPDAPAATPAHAAVEACQAEFDAVVAQGRGFGMAFAADQNRYPGPLHVLELSGRLGLDAAQESRVRALLQAMYAESVPKGARLLEAERALRRLFETGSADDATVRAAIAAVERARAELRAVHLLAHLRTRDVLTEDQRERYHQARWAARETTR